MQLRVANNDIHQTDEVQPTFAQLQKRLSKQLARCITDFSLIEEGDRIMVCLSGGKDSYTLLHLLERARRVAPVKFELLAVHLDQGQPGYDGAPLRRWLQEQGHHYEILQQDTYSVVKQVTPPGKTYCSACSRFRRGILYNAAERLGCTKIALGHHRDDALETLLLNLFFEGSLSSMPAKLVTADSRNTVIRPLLYAAESDIRSYSEALGFPILPCNLCGSQDGLWRQEIKRMLEALETRAPQVRQSMLAALSHVHPEHLLDQSLRSKLECEQEIVDQWEEETLRLARAGARGDQIVFVATNGC